MKLLFLFLDGVGLGDDDSTRNPFAMAELPTLHRFTGGARWLNGLGKVESAQGTFLPLDATLGVDGKPQSATGQATLMTGVNVPQQIGGHYGPKPTDAIRAVMDAHSMVAQLRDEGLELAFLNAYPSGFFDRLHSGKMLLSSNQYAMHITGAIPLRDGTSFYRGESLSVDFTGRVWYEHIAPEDENWKAWQAQQGTVEPPVLTSREAGVRMAQLAQQVDFAFFDQWLTDYIGHRGTLEEAVDLLQTLDGVVAGLIEAWDEGLIVITSDHGNIEDIDERGHTRNPVPCLVIGAGHREFASGLRDLSDVAPAILRAFGVGETG